MLRPYQLECIAQSLRAFAAGVRRVAVSLPVGSGKTVVFAHLIPQLPPLPGRGNRVLVLAHRTELLTQAAARISAANPHLVVAVEQGKDRAENADVVIASVPTLGRQDTTRLAALQPESFKVAEPGKERERKKKKTKKKKRKKEKEKEKRRIQRIPQM